jgi:putative ABC transport system permease protein
VGNAATIIGVVGRVDRSVVGEPPKATGYYSYRQAPGGLMRSIVVRTGQPVGAVAPMLRAVVTELDPRVPLFDVQFMTGRIEATLGPRRLALLALGVFATLALLLATLGVYGLMRHTTNERTREIGIRMAVGANGRRIQRMVLARAAGLVALGLALGSIVAVFATRAMSGILYGVSPADPWTLLLAALLLAVAGLASSFLPARRATRVDPMASLRAE